MSGGTAMDDRTIKNAIEALLFASGREVSAKRVSEALPCDAGKTRQLIDELAGEYVRDGRGVSIRKIKDSYQMCTNPEYHEIVRGLFEKNESKTLSQAAYETLAVIAYSGEATRARVESVRGVGCGSTLSTLRDKGLIEEAGRLDAPGRPVVYKPTTEFYRAFDLRSLDDLIPVEFNPEDLEQEEKDIIIEEMSEAGVDLPEGLL
jgi:segregation and condensation protein B